MPNAALTPQELLAIYRQAEAEIAGGAQETRIADRLVVRAELAAVVKEREKLERRCAAIAAGSGGLTFSTARFD